MSAHTLERAPVSGLTSLPRINLLPPEIHVQRRLRRVQMQLAGAGVLAVLIVIALFLLAMSSVSSANADLEASRVEKAELQEKVDGLANVRQTYTLVDQASGMLRAAGSGEVLWSSYLGDLGPLLPADAWLTKVTVVSTSTTAASAAPPPAGTPVAAPQGIATITFEGTALAHIQVANWLDSIAKERAWTNASFSKSDEKLVGSRKTYDFTSTVTVTAAALSGRYTKPAGS